ncbi:MAG: molybdopterin molybdotransferase MoeA [Clostridiales Family XIII bacterium]|jgi:molybdopterin molybdotransferase|nr:molybdopterin molybdotransferase MoeA [Clostridiales Family XIII bacterium]
MKRNVNVASAKEMILSLSGCVSVETISIDTALNRVIADDFIAHIAAPPFARSAFDGYAFRSEDVAHASKQSPVTLQIAEEVPAGHVPTVFVEQGHAAKILTGAPIPDGVDTVIKFELTKFDDDSVTIFSPVPKYDNIVPAGEDYPEGKVLIKKGCVITPAVIGMIASQGLDTVEVYRRPRVSMINVGSELVPLGESLSAAMIYNSSGYVLGGYFEDAGADFHNAELVNDEPGDIIAAIESVYDDSDIIVTTGGASTGDYDCAYRVCEQMNGDVLFWKIAMRPGGAILAYTLRGKLILSLSGNPGAAVLGLLYVGIPYLKKLSGRVDVLYEEVEVLLREALTKKNPKTRLVRGWLEIEHGKAYFAAEPNQRGGDLSSLIHCDLLVELPAGTPPLPAGACVKAYRIG